MHFLLTASIALGCLVSSSVSVPMQRVRSDLHKRAEYLDFNSAYSFDANTVQRLNWMASIPDDTTLTAISIPGTHDTMTFNEDLAVVGAQCQNNPLLVQLQSGIRYIDIRGWVLANDLIIAHGPAPVGYTYQNVLDTVFSFLDSNPTEVIIMRLREENAPSLSSETFIDLFTYYQTTNPDTAPGCAAHFWLPSTPGDTALPPIGQLRGKVVILQNFGSDPAPYGIDWDSSALSIEDNYDAGTVQSLPKTKWLSVLAQFENSASGASGSELYLNHLSASTQCTPIGCAAGNIGPFKFWQGMNDLTGEYLASNGIANRGIVIMDFPGATLINLILANNANLISK